MARQGIIGGPSTGPADEFQGLAQKTRSLVTFLNVGYDYLNSSASK